MGLPPCPGERDGEAAAPIPASTAAHPGGSRDGAADDQCLQRCPSHVHWALPSALILSSLFLAHPFPADPFATPPCLWFARTPQPLQLPLAYLPCNFSLILQSRSPLHAHLGTLLHPLSHIPWDGCFLLAGTHCLPTGWAIFCLPFPPGETGAMVSSTLKLGISILNGGNAEVQQVTEAKGLQRKAKRGGRFLCDSQFLLPCLPLCRKCWIILRTRRKLASSRVSRH